MNEVIRRNRERLQALPPRQIWIEATVNAIVVGMVSFYFSRSLWQTLGTAAFSLVLNLLAGYWMRRSQGHALKSTTGRRGR